MSGMTHRSENAVHENMRALLRAQLEELQAFGPTATISIDIANIITKHEKSLRELEPTDPHYIDHVVEIMNSIRVVLDLLAASRGQENTR